MALAVLSLGTMLEQTSQLADRLAADGHKITLADARFVKPLDTGLLDQLVADHAALLVVEEASTGGFSALVLDYLAESGALDRGLKIRTAHLPERYLDHASRERQLEIAGLDAGGLYEKARPLLAGKTARHHARS